MINNIKLDEKHIVNKKSTVLDYYETSFQSGYVKLGIHCMLVNYFSFKRKYFCCTL